MTKSVLHQIAALESWATTVDRTARTRPARQGLEAKFEREVDPEGLMDPQTRARAVEAKRKAYYLRLALKSAEARRLRRAPGLEETVEG
ncbi:hypothetical protein EV645_3983 [Kribbella rubisoli]|uniref:Uncharacterized protein n=1 Tax=Kribbella rubisoli TaxID=3075929 RepID=A0A4Q7X1E0_9ACTN|nr:hypothetical protein [Kribbella rubisoli]RZU16418.1 hypothetical protein EV645_3983 [Kribbella rubisoli]